MKWIREGINVFGLSKDLKATKTIAPPSIYLENHASCDQSKDMIARQLKDLLGKVGEVQPPWLVMQLVMVKGSATDTLL